MPEDNNYLDKISSVSNCTPEQVRLIVTEALKYLHKNVYYNQRTASDAILNCYYNFGAEACFHFGMLLTWCAGEDGYLYSETLRRLSSEEILPFAAYYDKWDKEIGELTCKLKQATDKVSAV